MFFAFETVAYTKKECGNIKITAEEIKI